MYHHGSNSSLKRIRTLEVLKRLGIAVMAADKVMVKVAPSPIYQLVDPLHKAVDHF